MPRRALVERRPWLLLSLATALAHAWFLVSRTPVPGVYFMALEALPLWLLSAYAVLRHKGRDTQLLALMLGLEGLAGALSMIYPGLARTIMMLGWFAGLSLFLSHRTQAPDVNRRIGTAGLFLLTPLLCYFAASRIGAAVPLFYGLALGGLAASAWMSTFAQSRVGVGGVLIVFGGVLQITVPDYLAGEAPQAVLAWAALYIGNLVLATGVTGELRMRAEVQRVDWDDFG
ncbi:hypothetical protein HT136_21970 [Novosphingobium profundi]|uniref:hypothetical protein n=1 Tax=Novosphingobium profundi TaxID=1774954 RepID=UPI001BD9485F|nr:hypothetical protein [Novosphingobium profundi]MBT0671044.1 hypothetical protein [Novosphingobium profundi]